MPVRPKGDAVLVDVGVVRGAYGLKGWVKVTPFSIDAAVLMRAREWWLKTEAAAPRLVKVEAARRHSGNIVAKWGGFDVPEPCEVLKGSTVAVDRAAFPPLHDGEAYWIDLIGAQVVNRAGAALGEVQGVRSNGAQDLMEVRCATGVFWVPMVAQYIDSVDAEKGVIRVDWEPGWS